MSFVNSINLQDLICSMDIELIPITLKHQKLECIACNVPAVEEAYGIKQDGSSVHIQCCSSPWCRSLVISMADALVNGTSEDSSSWPGKPA